MRKRTTKKINVFRILSILLIIIFIFFTPQLIKKLIKINKIECRSQFGNCDELLGYILTTDKSYSSLKKQIENDLNNNIQIEDYLMQYKIPSTIRIDLNLKKPTYSISNGNGKYLLVGKDKTILKISDNSNLPTLVSSLNNYKIGSTISDEDLFALKIIEKIAWLYSVNTGHLQSNAINQPKEILITLKEGILVHFPVEGDIDTLVGSLRLVFSRLNDNVEGIKMSDNITVSDIKEIDLRYKNVILR